MASMSDNPNVLDYLRASFSRLHARLDDIAQWQAETSKRLAAIERHLAGVRRDAVLDAETTVNIQDQVDTLKERLALIERRLEISG